MRKKTVEDCNEILQKGISNIISGGEDEWQNFLNSAAYTYKYNFISQIMIYSQRPDAMACAGMDVWNKRCGRWIKKGSEGIALMDENKRIYYVFDVGDTRSFDNRPFNLWTVREKDYNILSGGEPLENIIMQSINEYAGDMQDNIPGNLKPFIETSAAYITLKRAINNVNGIDTDIFGAVGNLGVDELISAGNIISVPFQ